MNNPYVQNVVSEFIAIFLLVVGAYSLHWFTGRRKLLAFFHVGDPKRFIVYVSRIRVRQNGSVGVDGQPRTFAGDTFALVDVEIFGPMQRLFNYIIPGAEGIPDYLKSVLISDVSVEFLPSPLAPDDVDSQAPFLALGSPGYNAASELVQNDFDPIAKFTPNNDAVIVTNLSPLSDPGTGFVLRARHPSSGRIVYYAAGLASVGTAGASIYLIRNWKRLQKRYGNDKPFVVLLRYSSNDPQHFEVIAERG